MSNKICYNIYVFQIPKTDTSLSIDVVTAQSDTYTIQWAYDNSFGPDALVENGTVEMVAGYRTGGGTYWHAERGSTIRVKLVPDYGYQVVGAKINDAVDVTSKEVKDKSFYTVVIYNILKDSVLDTLKDNSEQDGSH